MPLPFPDPIVPGSYRTRDGRLVKITARKASDSWGGYPFEADTEDTYTRTGTLWLDKTPNGADLVEYLGGVAPSPVPELPNPLVTGTYRTKSGAVAEVTEIHPTQTACHAMGKIRGTFTTWSVDGISDTHRPDDLVELIQQDASLADFTVLTLHDGRALRITKRYVALFSSAQGALTNDNSQCVGNLPL